MADNTQLPIPTTSGDVIASDDIGGVKFQRVKMIHGADGVNDGDVSSVNPMPIIGTISDGTTPSNACILLIGGVTAGGVAQTFETNASGHLNIADGGGSITVDATSLPLPTGAATETTLSTVGRQRFASSKTLTYTGENLTQVDEVIGGNTWRTTLTYSGSTLTGVSTEML